MRENGQTVKWHMTKDEFMKVEHSSQLGHPSAYQGQSGRLGQGALMGNEMVSGPGGKMGTLHITYWCAWCSIDILLGLPRRLATGRPALTRRPAQNASLPTAQSAGRTASSSTSSPTRNSAPQRLATVTLCSQGLMPRVWGEQAQNRILPVRLGAAR